MQQSKQLQMVGLGVQGDAPDVPIQPRLKDGIHLRWATTPDLAFPWFGFFLYRRQRGDDISKTCMFPLARPVRPGSQGATSIVLAHNERIDSDLPINLTDDFPAANSLEVDFGPANDRARAFVRVRMPPGRYATAAQVSIGFRQSRNPSAVRMLAIQGGTVVASEIVSGTPGEVVDATIGADAFDSVRFEAMSRDTMPDAALVQFCYVDFERAARQGWRPVPHCPQPITLPLTHPNYPATGNQPEDENAARGAAIGRISYGSPAPFAAAFADLHTELARLVTGGPAIRADERSVARDGGGGAVRSAGPRAPGAERAPSTSARSRQSRRAASRRRADARSLLARQDRGARANVRLPDSRRLPPGWPAATRKRRSWPGRRTLP